MSGPPAASVGAIRVNPDADRILFVGILGILDEGQPKLLLVGLAGRVKPCRVGFFIESPLV